MDTTERLPWQNDLDLKKFLVEVHDTAGTLGTDAKLIYWDEKAEELALAMMSVANMALDIVPNKMIAREIANMDLAPLQLLTKTRFNRPDNWIVKRYTPVEEYEREKAEPASDKWTDKLLQRIKGDKKPRVVDEDDD